jgi:dihydrodipicolinate synthase/N-acetylneuraminate lyase
MAIDLGGIIAALPTPFNESGDVAFDKLRTNFERWNLSDLKGYLILGSTGEFPHLTVEEKLSIIETARDSIPSDRLMLVSTGELSTRATVEMTAKAADRGADAAVVITPFYYKKLLDEEQLAAHYRRVADHSRIPIVIYLIPQFSGVYLRPETIASLAEHPNIIGLKESSGDLTALKDLFRNLTQVDFSVLVGAPAIFKEAMASGAHGGVLGVACLAPNACVALDRECRSAYGGRSDALQDRLTRLSRKTTVNGIGHLKTAMDFVGYYGYLPRSPLPVPTEDEKREIEAAIVESGLFEQTVDGVTWIESSEYSHLEYAD